MRVAGTILWHCGEDGILNVAGNSEKTAPGISQIAGNILEEILRRVLDD